MDRGKPYQIGDKAFQVSLIGLIEVARHQRE
jgi:hypothetical protein